MIGQTIDRYRIESKLGEGGMGVVYKARDTHLDRDVAIKVLPRDKMSDLVAFHSNSEIGPGDVYIVPADGGRPRNLTSHPANDTYPAFSRDGKWIYFSSTRGGPQAIWKMPASGGDAVKVSPDNVIKAIDSTDGASLYYVQGGIGGGIGGLGSLWHLPIAGGNPVKLAEGVDANSFDVVDTGVYYLERVEGTRLRFFNFATRQAIVVAEKLGNVGFGLGASRDGRTILFPRVDSSVDDLMLVENFR